MTDIININDIGTDYRITVTEDDAAVNISTASDLAILFKKPDGTTVEYAASKLTDGVDGVLHYQTVAGVIDQAGEWQYYGKVTFGAGLVFYTIDPATFTAVA